MNFQIYCLKIYFPIKNALYFDFFIALHNSLNDFNYKYSQKRYQNQTYFVKMKFFQLRDFHQQS